MFRDDHAECSQTSSDCDHAVVHDALDALGIELCWDARVISADVVLFHNPSCLKFQDDIDTTIIARQLIVITHENFVRPTGAESFDVAMCLSQILRNAFVLSAKLAPLSDWNRTAIQLWSEIYGRLDGWEILEENWFNICDLDMTPPRDRPARADVAARVREIPVP